MQRNGYAALLPQILPLVQPCPRSMAVEALRYAGTEFFSRTRLWRQFFTDSLSPGRNELALPDDAELVRVEYADFGGVRLILGIDYRLEPPAALLLRQPKTATDCCSALWVSLKPSRTADGVPDDYATWCDALIYGALARLKSMSGHNVGWTDAAGAELHLKLYEAEVQRVRDMVVREQSGWRLTCMGAR